MNGSNHNDKSTDMDTEVEEEEDKRQFDNQDYEGIIFKDILCNLHDEAGFPSSWILLDSRLTVDVICNSKMLSNIKKAKRFLVLYCNVGTMSVNNKGDLKGYGTVWYHPTEISNILSPNNVQKMY